MTRRAYRDGVLFGWLSAMTVVFAVLREPCPYAVFALVALVWVLATVPIGDPK